MKIIEKSDPVLLKNLSAGTVFRLKDNKSSVYMKLDVYTKTNGIKCVNLEKPGLVDMGRDRQVLPYENAELHLS